ncbi:hypothetical protein [Streptomyces sp. KN37]|uniref:hypothetical protein n=1 Tax=Streptomyces sp. KN37 TaxID=3090667 RepID=UPI002A75B2B6|nr:hypothetical protein [Streptomyces sp. KN37]WPO70223.1 hypothetical protein R9806_06060 [Streptomyces sp. KN37]
MSEQTRVAFLAEYRSARAVEDFDRALELAFAAMDHDADHPDEPSLMAELRGLHTPAAA